MIQASHRLLKLLKFFGEPYPSDMSVDEAWERRAAISPRNTDAYIWMLTLYKRTSAQKSDR
jgi:hypothetical protein